MFNFTSKLPKNSKWILEFTQGPNSAHLFRVKNKIFSQKTEFQTIDIVELFGFGKTLFLDEKLQISEADEFFYSEAITHPALITHPDPRKVLIIGGADGGAAFNALKHKSVKQVTLAEIDGELLKACRKFLPKIHWGVFKNPKLKVAVGDGKKFLEDAKEEFDVIITDLTAPVLNPPSYLLFTEEFYRTVYKKLGKDGIFSLQADSTNPLCNEIFTAVFKTVAKVFPIARAFEVFIPSYDTTWGFIVASKKYDPTLLSLSEIKKRIEKRGLKGLKFYDANIHQKIFCLPKYLSEAIKNQKNIIKNNKPMISSQ
ncbi:MAG: polyamine aminopropyltransferase [bacterium]|nr:polyamine aminopropyltransferase [bacterium]